MNLNKIKNLLELIGSEMDTNVFDDEEYLVLVANLLFNYGKSGLIQRKEYSELNLQDAFAVELSLNQSPNDVHLSAILQSHAILKWSESFKR